MTDHFVWFDPYAAREDAAYWEERAYYERQEIERYAEGCKGENRAMKAHIEHLTQLIGHMLPPLPFAPITVRAESVGIRPRDS